MKARVLAATMFDHLPDEGEVKEFAGKCAQVCYLPGSLAKVLDAPQEKSWRIAEQTLRSGHHSVYDHTYVSLALEGVPKIIAMLLNNEHAYTTSEQSGRYTRLETCGVAAELYSKWLAILQGLIAEQLPGLDSTKVEKLAMENARYFISVFAPTTTMVYTCSIRQFNYIFHWMESYCLEPVETDFELRLQAEVEHFCVVLLENCKYLLYDGLRDNKLRGLTLLATWRKRRLLKPTLKSGSLEAKQLEIFTHREEADEWGVRGYSTNYWGSFAQYAQAQRHRTLHYEMQTPDAEFADFYVPPILPEEMTLDWLEDMEQVRYDYPQGMLVLINESGRVEDLIQKCQERVCGEAQLEICIQTLATVREYYHEAMWNGGRWSNPFVAAILYPYARTTGCMRVKLSGHHCTEPCWWIKNGKEIEERIV